MIDEASWMREDWAFLYRIQRDLDNKEKQMKFKVISYGVNLGPDEGTNKGYNVFCITEEEALMRAQEFLKRLSPGQQEKAYVKVVEIKDVLVAEVHTAAEKGPNGEVLFAIARP